MLSIKNKTNLNCLNAVQQKGLNLQANKLNLYNKLILTLNKKIEKFPHNKINDKLGGSLNQNIIFNFSQKNVNTDRRLINNNLIFIRPSLLTVGKMITSENAIKLLRSKVTDLVPVQVKNPARLGIINNVDHIITSFFKGLACLITRPQFIHKTDKLIIRIYYYQNINNFNKDSLLNNNKSNFIYNLFNGTDAAKAQNSAPKSKNFALIFRNMLGQTKWNKIAQTMFKNNEAINSLELANISKKVFILFIKDLMNLTSSKKGLSIEKGLIQLQKGAPAILPMHAARTFIGSRAGRFFNAAARRACTTTSGKIGNKGFKKYNKLLIKLNSSTNSDALTGKLTRLSKIFGNKTLWAKLQNKINLHNNSLDAHVKPLNIRGKKIIASSELIGKGNLMRPVNKAKFNKIVGWSSNNLDLSTEYKTIATALLVLLKNNDVNSLKTAESIGLGAKLSNKINKNLTSLATQFTNDLQNNVNYIIGNTRSLNGAKILDLRPSGIDSRLDNKFKLSATYLKKTQSSNALNIIKLINHNLPLALRSKIGDKTLSVIKETFNAYSYRLNSNKTENALTGIFSSMDNMNKFKLLGTFLSKILKKNVDLQIIKLHNVGLEETILAKIISENAEFDKSSVLIKKLLRKIAVSKASLIQFNKQNKILNNNALIHNSNSNLHNTFSVPVFSKLNITEQIGTKQDKTISESQKNIHFNQLYDNIDKIGTLQTNPLSLGKVVGLNIKIAGRLMKDTVKPKQTVKTLLVGSFSKNRSNITSLSAFTSKNNKGTYRLTVKMAHRRTFSTF